MKDLSKKLITKYSENFNSSDSNMMSMNALTRSKLEDVAMNWGTFRKIDHTCYKK